MKRKSILLPGGGLNCTLFATLFGLFYAVCPAATFDGERAMADIAAQCAFGPRIPGTPGHAACREWIKKQIEEAGLTVWEQPFEARLRLTGKKEDAVNIWGFPGGGAPKKSFFALTAHWDTRPFADQEPEGGKREPFLGANDGGSGVAVALGIVRALKDSPLRDRIALIFFDAEDSGIQQEIDSWCLGSRFAVANAPAWFRDHLRLGINLDMVAARGLQLHREVGSERDQPDAIRKLWRIGLDLAPEVFVNEPIGPITDDHLPFIEAGFPFIDLIGFPYAEWHRMSDLPEACDAGVMSGVARAMMEFMRRENLEAK